MVATISAFLLKYDLSGHNVTIFVIFMLTNMKIHRPRPRKIGVSVVGMDPAYRVPVCMKSGIHNAGL